MLSQKRLFIKSLIICAIGITFSIAMLGASAIGSALMLAFVIFYFSLDKVQFAGYIFIPAAMFPLIYFSFRGFGFENIFPDLTNGIVGFDFSPLAFFVYFLGFLSMYLGFKLTALFRPKSRYQVAAYQPRPIFIKVLIFFYGIGIAAGILTYVKVGGIPVLNISLRWKVDPKLVLIMMTHIIIIPAIYCYYAASPNKSRIPTILTVISVLLISGLGARNGPVKILLTLFMTLVVLHPERARRLLIRIGIPTVAFVFIIGSLSKSSIYGIEGALIIPFLFVYLDITGTLYNFVNIVNNSDFWVGYFSDFRMYTGSLKSMIPGVDALYANFYVTEVVTGSTWVNRNVGGTELFFPMSLSPTLFGVGFASFGVLGLIIEAFLLGAILGSSLNIGLRNKYLAFVPGVVGAILCYGVYAGYLGVDALYVLTGTFLLLLFRSLFFRIYPNN